jgi:hypothetical protein
MKDVARQAAQVAPSELTAMAEKKPLRQWRRPARPLEFMAEQAIKIWPEVRRPSMSPAAISRWPPDETPAKISPASQERPGQAGISSQNLCQTTHQTLRTWLRQNRTARLAGLL